MKRRLLSLVLLAACGARGEPAPRTLPAADAGTVRLADSLVLTLADGNSVWMTEGRRGTDAAGAGCLERTLEVRRGDRRLKVPLLYTLEAPTRIDDTTFRAELYRDCVRMSAYRVSVRDAMPYRIPE